MVDPTKTTILGKAAQPQDTALDKETLDKERARDTWREAIRAQEGCGEGYTAAPGAAIKTFNLSCAAQLPLILRELHTGGGPMRIDFPTSTNPEVTSEQAKIREFLQRNHGRDLAELKTEVAQLLRESQTFTNLLGDTGFRASFASHEEWVDTCFKGVAPNKLKLEITNVLSVDNPVTEARVESVLASLRESVSMGRNVIMNVPSACVGSAPLYGALRRLLTEQSELAKEKVSVWVGDADRSLHEESFTSTALKRMTVEEFLALEASEPEATTEEAEAAAEPETAGPEADASEATTPDSPAPLDLSASPVDLSASPVLEAEAHVAAGDPPAVATEEVAAHIEPEVFSDHAWHDDIYVPYSQLPGAGVSDVGPEMTIDSAPVSTGIVTATPISGERQPAPIQEVVTPEPLQVEVTQTNKQPPASEKRRQHIRPAKSEDALEAKLIEAQTTSGRWQEEYRKLQAEHHKVFRLEEEVRAYKQLDRELAGIHVRYDQGEALSAEDRRRIAVIRAYQSQSLRVLRGKRGQYEAKDIPRISRGLEARRSRIEQAQQEFETRRQHHITRLQGEIDALRQARTLQQQQAKAPADVAELTQES